MNVFLQITACSMILVPFAPPAVGFPGDSGMTTVEIASGLDFPLDLTHAPGDPRRVFIAERKGLIRVVRDGVLLDKPFLDIQDVIRITAEGGLLGIAFHPAYSDHGAFFVNYTNLDGDTVIARYRVSTDPDRALPAGEVLLTIDQPGGSHNGGCIQFGVDGYLYIGMGDGGNAPSSQAPDTLLGKMLRIEVGGTGPYQIPADNPFVENPEWLDEIWASGLRNPWRFSLDSANGDMYIGDVGSIRREEINHQPGRSTGGENYGWPCREGTLCRWPWECDCNDECECKGDALVAPAHEFEYHGGAVVGGYVYRGCAIGSLNGSFLCYYIYHFYAMRVGPDGVYDFRDISANIGTNACTSFGVDAEGEIYICDAVNGTIHKLVPDPGGETLDCNGNGVYDTCERGDADGNGLVELSDLLYFAACMTELCPSPPCQPPMYEDHCCRVMDFDFDGDVDLFDFARFQPVFGGPP